MSKFYLGVFVVLLLATSDILSMDDDSMDDDTMGDDTEITIESVDGLEIKQPYSIFKQSVTLKGLIDDIQEKGVVTTAIPVPNVFGKHWENIIELLKASEKI